MLRNIALALAFGLLAFACGPQPSANAQEKHDNAVKTIATGTFHGKVHQTSGRATIYREANGKLVLRSSHDLKKKLRVAFDWTQDLIFQKT